MKKLSVKTVVAALAILFTGFTAFAFANGMGGYGNGFGNHHRGYGMMNGGMMDGYHMGYGARNNLSAEDQKKMDQEMERYLSATKELRSTYFQKQLDLEQAYAAPEKDQTKIDGLEKTLFDLSSQLDKERFEHMTAMRGLFGDKARGLGGYNGCF